MSARFIKDVNGTYSNEQHIQSYEVYQDGSDWKVRGWFFNATTNLSVTMAGTWSSEVEARAALEKGIEFVDLSNY